MEQMKSGIENDPYMAVLDELRELTLKKRAGYSPGADPFKNFRQSEMFGIDPIRGILVRVMDKISRIASLLENPDNDKVGESLRDTMMDGGNYLLIAVAVMDEQKRLIEAAADDTLIEQRANAILKEIRKAREASEKVPTMVRYGPDPEDVCLHHRPVAGPNRDFCYNCGRHGYA